MRVRKVRTTTNIDPRIWQTQQFRDLSQGAQWLFFTLHSHPKISWAGTLDYNPARLAELATDLIPDDVAHYAHELETMGYLQLDERTQELALTRYIPDNPQMRVPNIARATAIAIGDIHSRRIRATILEDLHHLATAEPYSSGINTPEIQAILTSHNQQ